MQNLITFIKTRRKEGEFGLFVDAIGVQTSYSLAAAILGWLKRQKKYQHNRDLELNPDHNWCRELPKALAIDPSLFRLFEIVEGGLRFKIDISEEERSEIRNMADSEYQPVLRT